MRKKSNKSALKILRKNCSKILTGIALKYTKSHFSAQKFHKKFALKNKLNFSAKIELNLR